MLWNPNLNANEVRNEFIQYYYAGVSDLVIDYLDNFETNYAFIMSREDRHDTVIPRDNVIVRIAPIRADNYYPMIHEKQNETTRKMFLEWSKVAKRTMIWDYHTNYTFYFAYYPTLHVWEENLKLYKNMGCEYIFMQSNHSELNDWKATMETYIASKMLWNPKLNPFELRKEYISYYYRGIEDLVESYIKNFEDNYDKKMNGDDVPLNTLQCGRIILHPKYYGMEFIYARFWRCSSL